MKRLETIALRRSGPSCRKVIGEEILIVRPAPRLASDLGMVVALLVTIASAPSPAAPTTDFWVGSNTPPSIWDSPDTTTNWLSSTAPTPTTYHDGDNAQFQNQYSYSSPPATAVPNSFTVTVQGAVSPGSVLVSTTPTSEYTFTGSGTIGGTGGLTLGSGALNITNANTYSGGTTVNGGTLLVNNTSGSATGTGSVTVNATGTLGGGGTISAATTIANGAFLAPSANPSPPPPTISGVATNLTFGNALTLSSGAGLNYNLNMPSVLGTGGGNDLTTVNGNLSLNPNLTVGINSGASFGAGTYELLHYNTLTNNSSNFMGWNSKFLNSPANLSSGQFYNLSFTNDTTHNNIDLSVATSSTPPTLPPGMSTSFVVSPTATAEGKFNNTINISGNTGPGGPSPSLSIATSIATTAAGGLAKPFSIGWGVAPAQVPPGTPVFVPPGVFATGPLGIVTGAPGPGLLTCPPLICLAGVVPFIPPEVWLPWPDLSPFWFVTDANPSPTYYGVSFSSGALPIDPAGIYLADLVNGKYLEPDTLDSLANGPDACLDFKGSFLSCVQLVDPSIMSLSALTNAQWDLFLGSYGVDLVNDIAWVVDNIPDAVYDVIAPAPVREPGTLAVLGAGFAGLAFFRRRKSSTQSVVTQRARTRHGPRPRSGARPHSYGPIRLVRACSSLTCARQPFEVPPASALSVCLAAAASA